MSPGAMSASAMASAAARANSSALVASCLPNLVIPTPITATRRMPLLLERPDQLTPIILARARETKRRPAPRPAAEVLQVGRPRAPNLLVERDAILAGSLGRVERLVGCAHQGVGRGLHVLGQGRDAEARGDGLPVGEVERGQHVADPVRVQAGAALGGLDEQHGELVAAVAADHVDAAGGLEEDVGDAPERLVARGVTELVVDLLQTVQVEQDHRDRVVESAVARDLLREPDGEEAAIVEPGDLVPERVLLEPRIAGLDVPERVVE